MATSVQDFLNAHKKKLGISTGKSSVEDFVNAHKARYDAEERRRSSYDTQLRDEYDSIVERYNTSLDVANNVFGTDAERTEVSNFALNYAKIKDLQKKYEQYRSVMGDEYTDSYISSLDEILAGYKGRAQASKIRSNYDTKAAFDNAVEQAQWYEQYSDMDAEARAEALEMLRGKLSTSYDVYGPVQPESVAETYGPFSESEEKVRREAAVIAGLNARDVAIAEHDRLMGFDTAAAQAEIDQAEKDGSLTSAQLAEKRKALQDAQAYQKVQEYNALKDRPDFAERSKAEGGHWLNSAYEYINADELSGIEKPLGVKFADAIRTSMGDPVDILIDETSKNIFAYMTDDEKAIYTYLVNTAAEGEDPGGEYLDSLRQTLEYRSAQQLAKESNVWELAILAGASSGFEGVHAIFDPTSAQTQSALQLAAEESSSKLGFWGKLFYDAVYNTANQIPSMGVGAVVGAVTGNPIAGQWTNAALMGLGAAGNAYEADIQAGKSKEEAMRSAIFTGISETVLEKFLGIAGGNKLDDVVKGIKNAYARGLVRYGKGIIEESLEESLQSLLEQTVKQKIAYGESPDSIDWSEVGYSAMVAAISATPISVAQSGTRTMAEEENIREIGNTIRDSGRESELIGLARNYVSEIKDGKLSGNQQFVSDLLNSEELDAYNLGLLYQSMQEGVYSQNLSEITSALEAKGLSPRKANRVGGQLLRGTSVQNPAWYASDSPYFNRSVRSMLDENSRGYSQDVFDIAMEMVYNEESDINRRNAEYTGILYDVPQEMQGADIEDESMQSGTYTPDTETGVQNRTKAPAEMPVTEREADTYDEALHEVIEGIEGITPAAANVLMSGYDTSEGISATDYALGVKEAYTYGEMGMAKSALASTQFAGMLSERAINNAYEVGRMAGEAANIGKEIPNETSKETGEGVRVRRSGKRDGGKSPEGQVRTVERDAGQDQTRGESRSRSADEGTSRLTYSRDKVSARSLGIADGSQKRRIRIVESGETEAMKKAKALASERGLEVVFFGKSNLYIGEDISARAFISGNKAYIRVDHPKYTADQLMRHEAGHDMIARGEVNPDTVRERIIEMYGEQNVGIIADMYMQAYEGTGLDADEVWEEVICDSLGDINIFADAESLGEVVGEFLEVLGDTTRSEAVPARAPPGEVSKASREESKDSSIKQQLNAHIEEIRVMQPVKSVTYTPINKKTLHERISEEYKKIGYRVDRQNFGVIEIGEKQINKGIDYINTESEKAAMVAIPSVLKRGIIIDGHVNHKNRNYDTITIAAPVSINGNIGFVAVVVTKTNGKNLYRVHRVLSPDGSEFTFNYNENAEPTSDKLSHKSERVSISSASKSNITQKSSKVNRSKGKTSREIDVKYMSAVESGDMLTAQRLVDEAAKAAGYDRLFYHGARKGGGFTEFRDWSYFTENKQYAERYANREKEGSLYTTYVKLDKPFDTRSAKDRKLFYEIRQEYGLSEIGDSGLPDWTDGYDIAEYIDESGFDYDGIILDEGGDLVDGKPVSRGLSYVVRKSAQIKSADPVVYDDDGNVIPLSERFNPKKKDIRYSRELPVEMSDDEAISHFGRTFYWKETGYLLTDGRKLDFSGKHNGGSGGYRSVDHREILEIYPEDADIDGNEAMVDFMSRGNIRIMPEGYGINLQTKPTSAQAEALADFISRARGEVYVDIDNEYGETVESVEYPRGTRASKVIADINAYFDSGTVPEVSDVARFHSSDYSREVDTSGVRIRGTDESVYDILGESERVEAENEKLRGDVARLRELVKLQRTLTHGQLFTKTSLNTAAKELMEKAGVKRGKEEIIPQIEEFFRYIARGEDLVYEEIMDRATAVAADVVSRIDNKAKPDARFKEIADGIRGVAGSLTSTRAQEVASSYGSVNSFRKSNFGKIRLTNDGTPLDVQWQEWSRTYPELFDADTPEGDMPARLAEIADAVRETTEIYNEYEMTELTRELASLLYDQYWRATTLQTFADKKQRQINELKAKHYREMSELRQSRDDKVRATAQYYRDMVARVRENKDAKIERMKAAYAESRENARERHEKSVMRSKIKNTVASLDKLLRSPTKEKHVPIALQSSVAALLDAINMDTVDADPRVKKYEQFIAEERAKPSPDAEKIASYEASIERIRTAGGKLGEKLKKMKEAYAEIKNSVDPEISGAYHPEIAERLENLAELVGDTPLAAMSLEQMDYVYESVKMVESLVRNANKGFKVARQQTITELGEAVVSEESERPVREDKGGKVRQFMTRYGWNNLKPSYAFDVIGSRTLRMLFDNMRSGEDVYAVDISDARTFFREKAKKYGYDSWDLSQEFEVEVADGRKIMLTLNEMMSLYAYSKRAQAEGHLEIGGFVRDDSIEVVKKNKLGIPTKRNVNTANANPLSKNQTAKIVAMLSEDQIAFVDEMQDYLSTVMGAKGNEVSRQLYGIDLFREKVYFPLHSAEQFLFTENKPVGETSLRNWGAAKEILPGANNPIILSGFMDVWSRHVNQMSTYHAFVLPIEDFTRVYNYKGDVNVPSGQTGVKTAIQNAHTSAATNYVAQLLRDINGGVKADPIAGDWIGTGISRFKKAATFASASVVIQQPSAMVRAMMYIDPKYFAKAKKFKNNTRYWNECKKYNPVAIVKEMGGIDTGTGAKATEWITSQEYDGIKAKAKGVLTDEAYRDEVLSAAPAMADRWAWTLIWNAAKEQIAETTDFERGSPEFYQAAHELFTKAIVETQVYDSVFTRSAAMRSKDSGMKMLTSFMAEPTTSVNMYAMAAIHAARGNKKLAAKMASAAAVSIIVNNVLVSLVYAARDDDEDQTYIEKYLESLATGSWDVINIFSMLPVFRDLISLWEGYDVERSDMSAYADLIDAFRNIGNGNKSAWERIVNVATSIGNLTGIPLKNIYRDCRAVYNVVTGLTDDEYVTWKGVKNSLIGAVPFKDSLSDAEQLYVAIKDGDTEHYNRVAARFKDEKAINNALKKAIAEADPAVAETASRYIGGDVGAYASMVDELVKEGFDEAVAADAVKYVVSKVKSAAGDKLEGDTKAYDKAVDYLISIGYDEKQLMWDIDSVDVSTSDGGSDAIFKKSDYISAYTSGDEETLSRIEGDLVEAWEQDGKSEDDIESSIRSYRKAAIKEGYLAGTYDDKKATKLLIRDGIIEEDPKDKDAAEHEAYWLFHEWKDKALHDGESGYEYQKYGEFYTAVESGVNLKKVISYYNSHGVDKSALASAITNHYKPLIRAAATKAEKANIKARCLTAYTALGYSRTEMNKKIDGWLKE